MDKHKIKEHSLNGGVQKVYRFENNYGASVVKHNFSYGGEKGLWELAVVVFDNEYFDLCYDTPITNDVLGYLSDEDVTDTLEKIKAL